MQGTTKVWMLRVDKHLHGPFSTDEMSQLILNSEVSEVDEVAPAMSRWFYLRDRNEFLVALEQQKLNNRGDFNRSTSTLTGTESLSDSGFDKTQELTSVGEMTKTSPMVDFGVAGADAPTLKPPSLDRASFSQAPVAAHAVGAAASKTKSKQKLWLALLLLFALAVGYIFLNKNKAKNLGKIFVDEAKQDFKLNWSSGDLVKSYINLKANADLKQGYSLAYGALALFMDQNKALAGKVLDSYPNKAESAWKNLKGLSLLSDGDIDKAESYLLSSVEANPKNLHPLVNLGLLKRQQKNWSDARRYFESVYSRKPSGQLDEVGFYLAEAWANEVVAVKDFSGLSKVQKFINLEVLAQSTYAYELFVLSNWMKTYSSSVNLEVFNKVQNFDPEMVFSRKRYAEIYNLLPQEYSYICKGGALSAEFVPSICTLIMWNVFKFGENDLASLKSNQEASFALKSFLFDKAKDSGLSAEYLSKAMQDSRDKSAVKHYVQSRFCHQNGNYKCAAEHWLKALAIEPDAFTAHTGLAEAYFETGDIKRAKVFYERAKGFSESYFPLRKLEIKLEKYKDS